MRGERWSLTSSIGEGAMRRGFTASKIEYLGAVGRTGFTKYVGTTVLRQTVNNDEKDRKWGISENQDNTDTKEGKLHKRGSARRKEDANVLFKTKKILRFQRTANGGKPETKVGTDQNRAALGPKPQREVDTAGG